MKIRVKGGGVVGLTWRVLEIYTLLEISNLFYLEFDMTVKKP